LNQPRVELQELWTLNVELTDTLILVGRRLTEYIEEYHIEVEGIEGLANLMEKASNLLERIAAEPYARNPVVSDAFIHPKPSDEDSTAPGLRLCYLVGTRLFLLTIGT